MLRDDRAEPFREGGLRRHEGLFDVFGRVLSRGQQDVVVRVIGPGALEDLEMDLLADLGLHRDGVLAGGGGHQHLLPLLSHFHARGRPDTRDPHARLARMRVLAVDTSTMAGGVALVEDARVVGESLLDVRTTHSERLMLAIDRAFTDAGWEARHLDGIAVAVGPGSFTGLRIGLAAVKGLALALRCPIAPVSTLDAMAAALPWATRAVCPVLDARRGEVYASLYRWDGTTMRREWAYLALSPEALAAKLTEPVIGVGDGAALVPSPWVTLARPMRRGAPAATVGWLGEERLRRGDTVAPGELVPMYLRPSEAELKRRAVVVY